LTGVALFTDDYTDGCIHVVAIDWANLNVAYMLAAIAVLYCKEQTVRVLPHQLDKRAQRAVRVKCKSGFQKTRYLGIAHPSYICAVSIRISQVA
jgi:hypothetical protein